MGNGDAADVHVVATAFKKFLRELKEPLFPFEFYRPLLNAFSAAERSTKMVRIFKDRDILPAENVRNLISIFNFLDKVVNESRKNKMTTKNLAVCFSPSLL